MVERQAHLSVSPVSVSHARTPKAHVIDMHEYKNVAGAGHAAALRDDSLE